MKAWRRPRVTLLGVLAAMAALSVVTAAIVIGRILAGSTNALFSTRADVEVPSLLGLSAEEAGSAAARAGLQVVWQQTYSPTHEAGTICAQRPRAGRTVKEGQQLTLTASQGARQETVPDLWRQPQYEASQTLRDAGFGVAVEFVTDSTVEAYTVLRTEPAAGTLCEAGSIVKLVVARPMPDPYRQVPLVTGLPVQEACSRLETIGLLPIVVGDRTSGTVTAQSPVAYNLVVVCSAVRLYVK